ncbi:hypothetical protein CLV62_11257 [Dysgonomonas alginatilytica]|uniref:Uncharacterized protein n=1 Tax=Dysgonomonas alginatilytica TaxID=1605892 RepID=A0A2V3PN88_9BACT|nr:hypothetical protein [Dysgonomonas alginatilytica]PXV63808.1 hypothetical protein CLV62_11257 [Dysgonomonas alginatilytica]
MKKSLLLIYILVFSRTLFVGCSDDDKEVEILTSNFVLGEPYRWNLSKQKDMFHIINNYAELQDYIEAVDGSKVAVNAPDFDKYTLILASGTTQSGVAKIETKLIKHNDIDYTFEVYVFTNMATVVEGYIVAVTVPRLPNNAKVVKKAMVKL